MPISSLIERVGAEALADAAGVDRTTPYSWRNGVPPKYVVKVADAFGLAPHELRPDIWPAPDSVNARQDAAGGAA
jgi:hypothetical protein